MPTYFSGLEVTERENLADQLSILSIAEAPILRSMPSREMANRVHEYSIDDYIVDRNPAAPHANTRLEGAEIDIDTPDPATDLPTRLKAIAEIQHFGMKVSNTDREAIVAGVTDTFNYRAHKTYVRLLNNIENVLLYGQGGTITDGSLVGLARQAQGLLYWTAWTGQERLHGTAPAMDDPYGVLIQDENYATFFDAAGANLSKSMLYNRVLATAARSGFMVPGAMFMCGYKVKNLIADWAVTPAGAPSNERNVAASDLGFWDSIDWIRTPLGMIGFRTNRYLDIEGSTVSIDSTAIGGTPGTVNKTYQTDEIVLGQMPGYCAVGWYRPPHFREIPSTGDYSALGAIAEFSFINRHPTSLCGVGNCLS